MYAKEKVDHRDESPRKIKTKVALEVIVSGVRSIL